MQPKAQKYLAHNVYAKTGKKLLAPESLGLLSLSLAGFKDPALSKGLAQSNSNHDKYLLQTFTIFYIIHPFNDGALKKIDSCNAEVVMQKRVGKTS